LPPRRSLLVGPADCFIGTTPRPSLPCNTLRDLDNFAKLAKPLTNLTRVSNKWDWNQSVERRFRRGASAYAAAVRSSLIPRPSQNTLHAKKKTLRSIRQSTRSAIPMPTPYQARAASAASAAIQCATSSPTPSRIHSRRVPLLPAQKGLDNSNQRGSSRTVSPLSDDA
jgi:hypothetical protein